MISGGFIFVSFSLQYDKSRPECEGAVRLAVNCEVVNSRQ